MRQRQLRVLVHHQSQPQLPQIVAPLFVMPTLRQFRFRVGAGDVGIEVGGVVGQGARVQLFDADELAHNGLLDVAQQRRRQGVHLVPEMLTVQSRGRKVHQLGQAGGLGPSGESAFAARRAGPADHACQQGLAHAETIPFLHPATRLLQCLVDLAGDVQLLRQTI